MARVIAIAAAPMRLDQLEMLRSLAVCSCAAALIWAGQAFPVLPA